MSVSIKNKARIIASLTVGGFIAIIFLAVGCKGEYGVIEEERVSFAPTENVVLEIPPDASIITPSDHTPAEALQGEEPPVIAVDTTRKVTYEQAEAAFLARNYVEATRRFTRYTEQKPENAWGYYMLGLSAKRAGDLTRAVQALEKAAAIDPQHLKSWVNLGRTYMALSQPQKSLESVEKALILDPAARDAYRIKGRAYHQMGQLKEAEQAYQQALQIDNEDAWSMNNLAFVLINQQAFDAALPLLARAVELNNNVAVFYNNLGMVLENKGHFKAAENAYASAVALDEGHAHASANQERMAAVQKTGQDYDLDFDALARAAEVTIKSWESATAEHIH